LIWIRPELREPGDRIEIDVAVVSARPPQHLIGPRQLGARFDQTRHHGFIVSLESSSSPEDREQSAE
jgi:hypothetical protein